ncbi:MAG: nuclear transport factor 2 family protein [Acidobacteria bacterium]|nr:nuclear transport factor 2 family protein [Acidobacteriota bacterium]
MAIGRSVSTATRGLLVLVWANAMLLGLTVPAGAQSARTPEQEVEALVMEYTRLEDAADMATQSKLIAPDRWWHGAGGRRTDNATWMKVQQEGFANSAKRYPGLHTMREVRDLKIKMVAPTVAVASFIWFPNRLIPGDLPMDKVQTLGPSPIPQVVSSVWARQADGWKIVSSHSSPLYTR